MTFQTIPQCTSPNMRPPPLPLTFSEETVAKNKMGPTHFFEGKALGTRLEERKLLSPAPLSVRLEQTEGTPYKQLPHY